MHQPKLTLSGLFIYPIKSCRGISLHGSLVEERGLQYDRRWMLVDENNMFMTQRAYPKMSLIEVSITENGLRISAPKMNELVLPFVEEYNEMLQTVVWDDVVPAAAMGTEADEWFSEFLHKSCRLVFQPDKSIRPVDPGYVKKNEHTSLSDGYPFLILSDSSLEALNQKLISPVPMNRFRPNLTISGSAPFAEDSWKMIRVNGIPFRLVKPCGRCAITTVNQSTGEMGKEPLRTLAEFRTVNNKVLFGQNTVTDSTGIISVGDPVEIIY